MLPSPVLLAVAAGCAVAAVVWLRSSLRLERAWRRIQRMAASPDAPLVDDAASRLAGSAFRKELHTGVLYAILAGALAFSSLSDSPAFDIPLLLVAAPIAGTILYGRRFLKEAS